MVYKPNFGAGEFRVVLSGNKTVLFIHGDHVVACSDKDVYVKVFDQCVKMIGGRIDELGGD